MSGFIQSGRFSGATFDPVTAFAWHSLWYAEGPDMIAQGYSNGSAVGTWPNETTERDQVQATAGAKPLFVSACSTLNNQPAVAFDGIDDNLQTVAWVSAPTYPINVIAICSVDDTTMGHVFNGGAADSNALFVNTYWQLDSGYPHNGYWTPVDVNTPKMIRGVFSGTGPAHYGYENETLKVTWTPSGFTAARFGMGSGPFGGSYKAMKLAFLGIYQGDITANPNWAEFKAWVATHYGITLA